MAIVTETKLLETTEKPRLNHMVACKTIGEYKRNQAKMKRFCLEEKANKAKEEEKRVKLARANNSLQPATTTQRNVINRTQMGHAEAVALARRNQLDHKGARTTRQAKHQPRSKSAMRPTSPGNNIRPQWLKNARNRITKKTSLNDFKTKSKEAAIKHANETVETKQDKTRTVNSYTQAFQRTKTLHRSIQQH